ncbi:restriction endonuclease subunit S [Flavobacterium granuli]|uniref:Type I restriction enzyme S subunit n=1 Tax=Flavobacterium granuli TaxID=280093 RepID=A0A1M5NXQ4_9FLAO|nr:restriction endonuclease subunit S [Flavobacterium granuli]PRZ23433.1 type I restriction enzyme S subunit [Flavobacterium granuli]SHG94245.1 type I restriction enzyme, S subunit [Flavobacterium granuli]
MTKINKENKSMSKVPNLRFPQFTEEWNREKIGSILTIGSGKDYKHLSKGTIPVFGTGGYMTSVNEYLYDGESVCIGRKGTINKPSYVNGKFWTVDTLFFTHSFQKVVPKFVYYVFEKVNWLKYNEASGVPSLSKSTIEQIEINISCIEEQQKIATFLSLLDSRIQTQNKIIEELKLLKNTLIKKIFSRQLKFKDSNRNDFPEWEVKKIKEVGKFSVGGDLNKLDYKKEKLGKYTYPIYANGEGFGLYGYASSFQYPENCVTVSGRGNLGVANVRYEKFCAIVRLIVIYPDFDIHPKYLQEIINTVDFAIESTGVPQLTVPQISNYSIAIACLEEQTKIANFLLSIDSKIDTEIQILQKLEEQKKYLLQNLFV